MGELIRCEALIRETPGTGTDTRELRRAACSVPRHCHRVQIHQHFMLLQEKMIVQEGNSQGVFDVVFHECLPSFREEDVGGSSGEVFLYGINI